MSIFAQFESYMLTERCVARNTFHAYRRDLRQLEAFLQSHNIDVPDIKIKDIKLFLGTLKLAKLTARSMARKISAMKVFFTYAHERFGIKNCGEHLTVPKIKKGLPHFLSESEIEALLRVTEIDTTAVGIRNKVIMYLLYVSGMRISELVSMRVSDIHFDIGFLKIKGKGEKERMIPVPELMQQMLRDYLMTGHRDFMTKKGGTEQNDYLFPTWYAGSIKPITRQACWIILNNLWLKTGIQKTISPHQLRHSLATHMLKNGVDLRSLQHILGHENIGTVEIYTHVETSHIREVYDKKHPRS